MEYTQVYKAEGTTGKYNFGIKLEVAIDREFTAEDKKNFRRQMEELQEKIIGQSFALDPQEQQLAALEKQDLINCFGKTPIYVEEIPNGYCSRPCCSHKPWLIVTTKIGRIKIGWRKRVISIDYSDTLVTMKAADMFPDEEVTKDDRLIHAWSYERATEYLDIIINCQIL